MCDSYQSCDSHQFLMLPQNLHAGGHILPNTPSVHSSREAQSPASEMVLGTTVTLWNLKRTVLVVDGDERDPGNISGGGGGELVLKTRSR